MRVRSVAGSGDLRAFIDLPYRLQGRDPLWVPPLRVAERARLSRARNPFFREAEAEYFVAWAGERAVGRIAAIANRRHDEVYRDGCAFFGFFECEEDGDAARALLDAAGGWARERGYRGIRGPASFSTNHECGLLVEGFHTPPTVMMPHNPPYYAELLRAAGFEKAKDLIAFEGGSPGPLEIPDRSRRAVERLAARSGVRLRAFDARDFKGEVERIKRGYNEAWERNWGFVPMSRAEFDAQARDLVRIAHPALMHVAEIDGVPAGFVVALPDLNVATRACGGRLLPFGWWRFLRALRRVRRIRVITLGVLPELRKRGIEALLLHAVIGQGIAAGFDSCEASWILEDNRDMLAPLEALGHVAYRRYRIYTKALT
jgi:GNAT superfamily N-acetyltransferase